MYRHLFALAAFLVIILPGLASAQDVSGYAFTGIARHNSPLWEVGAGMDRALTKNVSLVVEGGVATSSNRDQTLGQFTVNALYHFTVKDRRIDPFVGGGTGVLGNWGGGCGAFAIGGGLNYWARQRIGVRLEVKDSICAVGGGGEFQMIGFRIGVTFR